MRGAGTAVVLDLTWFVCALSARQARMAVAMGTSDADAL